MRLEQLITGNDDLQQHVASERNKQALVAVAPAARRAIKLEILPQIEESILSIEVAEALGTDTKQAIEAAFSYKNDLYTRLIRHKGIEQGDGQFLTDLLLVMDEWLRNTKTTLNKEEVGTVAPDSERQQVEITVKVDPQGTPTEDLQIKDLEGGAQLDMGSLDLFELGDMRL